MIDEKFELVLETIEGSSHKLLYSPQRLYYFLGRGITPLELSGSFTGVTEALREFNKYSKRTALLPKRVELEADVPLDSLTTKAELLSFADNEGIAVAKGMTSPKQIKKFLKDRISQ